MSDLDNEIEDVEMKAKVEYGRVKAPVVGHSVRHSLIVVCWKGDDAQGRTFAALTVKDVNTCRQRNGGTESGSVS